ncbi:CHAT domain-containing protein [Irpex lacteus]|nr:CHAT domain-containing protein [Irpex lacteus]
MLLANITCAYVSIKLSVLPITILYQPPALTPHPIHTPICAPPPPLLLPSFPTSMSGPSEETSSLEAGVDPSLHAASFNASDNVPPHIVLGLQGDHAREQYLAHSDLDALELFVSCYRQAVEVTPDGVPEQLHILSNFGVALCTRFQQLGNHSDLEESITIQQVVNALTPEDSPDKPSILANLAAFIRAQFQLAGNFEDLEEAISLQTHALDLTPDGHQDKPARLNNLGAYLLIQFERAGLSEYLTKAITLQSQAVDLTPDDHPDKPSQLTNLSHSLVQRFKLEGNIEDLEQAITLQSHAVRLTPDSHPDKHLWINNCGNGFLNRFERLANLEDLQRAVVSFEHALELTPDSHLAKLGYLNNLSNTLRRRFEHSGQVRDLTRAITCQSQAVDLTPNGHPDKPSFLHNLGSKLHTLFDQSGSLEALNKAIAVQSQAMELTPDGHYAKSSWLYNLANTLCARFEKTGNASDLSEAIRHSTQAVNLLPADHPEQASQLRLLGGLYQEHAKSCHAQPQDFTHALQQFSMAMQHTVSPPQQRHRAAVQYTDLLSTTSSLLDTLPEISLLEAYELQLSLMSQCLWLGNSVHDRYSAKELPYFGHIVAKAATAAINAGEFKKAVEWIESGRTLVWSQILQLRTPLDDLHQSHPLLADRLQHVSQALQQAATSSSSTTTQLSFTTYSNPSSQLSYDMQAKSFHGYADEYEKLLQQIRKLEGFESFLHPKTLSQLAGACKSGPIVLINMHESRCDALVLHDSIEVKIKHIPLPLLPLEHAKKLRRDLWSVLTARGLCGRFRDSFYEWSEDLDRGGRLPGTGMRNDPMFKILADLWTMVVEPIIDFICKLPTLETTKLPHITWCPTGPLAFLPLHAAGIYYANGPPSKTVMDFAVSSYTPTLEALLKPHATVHETPRVLVVSQPATPYCSAIPGTTTEAGIVMSLTGELTQVLEDTDGIIDIVLEAMATHNWVHLACHGMQDRNNPIDSSFALYDKKLTLGTLMSKHLPNADLAVLSACQTATGDEKLVEEAVHLAAGMLTIGYKSVIGTMWSIYDDSAPVVMAQFYEVMMEQVRAGKELQPAYALHKATKVLRERYGVNDFVRWIPFVHFGL